MCRGSGSSHAPWIKPRFGAACCNLRVQQGQAGVSRQGGVGSTRSCVEAVAPAVESPVAGSRLYAKLSEIGCVLYAKLFQPAGKGCHYSQHHSDTKGGHGYGCRDKRLGINPGEGRRVVLGRRGPQVRGGGNRGIVARSFFDRRQAARAFYGSETYRGRYCRAQQTPVPLSNTARPPCIIATANPQQKSRVTQEE